MPSSKTATKSSKSESDTLAFAKAINKLVQKQEDFTTAIEDLKNLNAENMTSIQLELKSKREELNNLTKEFDVKKKDLQIKVDQEFNEYSYEKAKEIIGERGEIPVDEEEYTELESAVEQSKEEMEEEMQEKISEEQQKAKQALAQALKNKDLEHKAHIANLQAEVEQLKKERKIFESTIKNLREDIEAQRQLTKQVAEASKSGAISQTFGK